MKLVPDLIRLKQILRFDFLRKH